MTKNSLFFLVFIFQFSCLKTIGQTPTINNYVILTVEDSYSKGFEGVKKLHWIIEIDSIKSSGCVFSPLLLSGFSKGNFDSCCKGIEVDPVIVTSADTIFDMGKAYFGEAERLDDLIRLKRRQIEKITKEWIATKGKEMIAIYITPVTGRFCASTFAKTGTGRTGYYGKILIPFSSFELNLEFWKSSKFSILFNQDFSTLKLDAVR